MNRLSVRREPGAVVATNRNLRIRSWNAAAERAYGWSSREAEGKNLDELLCSAYSGLSADQAHAALFTRGRLDGEVSHTARDGTVLKERGSARVMRDGEGVITGVVLTFKCLDRGASVNQPSAEAADSLPDDAAVFPGLPADFTGDVWVYNIPSGREWHARQVSPGMTEACAAALPDDSGEAGSVIRKAVAEGRDTFSLQHRAAKTGGGAVWSLTEGRIEYNDSGRAQRILGTTIDISELKDMEAALKSRADELARQDAGFTEKSRQAASFFTDVSHDFKTPLSIMLVNLQMMEYCLSDLGGDMNKRLLKAVAMMRQNTLKLLRLSGNFLDVTRLDAGFMKARLVNADIVEIASKLTEAVGNYAAGRGVEVRFDSDAASRVMPADGEKLERILLNLLSNAVKNTPPGGHVAVALRNRPDGVTLCVSDDGFGMGEGVKELVRERLSRGNNGISQTRGNGMGLLLAKALTELLRGRIWFESRQGTGSSFFVELPTIQADWPAVTPEADGMTRDRKVEMEFSDIDMAP